MKKDLSFIVVILLLMFAFTYIIYGMSERYRALEEKWKIAEANVKASNNMLSDSESKSTALQLTVDQLTYFQDSILKELDETRKELKIKDSKLKALQYISSSFSKKDTIVLKDTIFAKPEFKLDTIVGDDWYKVQLGLQYPSTIAVNPEFKSEKNVVISTKKETVNPPSKIFFIRWFQKKHTILNVDVVEKNPYTHDEVSKYIEIIK